MLGGLVMAQRTCTSDSGTNKGLLDSNDHSEIFFQNLLKGKFFAVWRVKKKKIRFSSPFCVFDRLPS